MPSPEPISALATYTTYHAADEVLVLDTVDTTMASTGTNKRVTIPSLVTLAGIAPLNSPAFTGTPTGSGAGLTGITEAQINPAAATTVFNSNGSITETYGSGQVVTTVFNSDGSITTTYGAPISHTVTTTFGSTGTITESVA